MDKLTFEAGTMVHMRARLAYVNDATLIDEDGTLDANDAIKVSPWCIAKVIEYGKTIASRGDGPVSPSIAAPTQEKVNVVNNYNDAYDHDDQGGTQQNTYELEDSDGKDKDKDVVVAPGDPNSNCNLKKIKIKCSMMIEGKDVKKPWTLYNNERRQEFTYDALLEKARKALRKVDGIENKNILFKVGQNTVANQEDFETYCINANDPEKIEMTASYD